MLLRALILFLCLSSFSYAKNATWKVLVYMQADNDLAEYAAKDLQEIYQATRTGYTPVLVELDLPGDSGIQRFKVFSENKSAEQINIEKVPVTPLKVMGETEYSQEERLLHFLIDMEEQFPTDHTMLVIWGHGEGFGQGNVAQFGGVAVDNNPLSKLTIGEIKANLNAYKMIFGKKVEVLAMDACLMQTLEVAVELFGKTDFLIGSTQIQDFDGLPYDLLVSYLDRGVTPLEVAKEVPRQFEQRALENKISDKRTMSAVSLGELEQVFISELEKTSEMLLKEFSKDPFLKFDFMTELGELPFFLGESRDLTTLLAKFDSFFYGKPELEKTLSQIRKTREALHQSLVSYYYGASYQNGKRIDLGSFKAFGVWFPTNIEDYNKRIVDFDDSVMYQNTPSWKKFISSFFSLELF